MMISKTLLTNSNITDRVQLPTTIKEIQMSKSTKSTPAPRIYNYLEQWNTRYGSSTRIVTRQQGKFVTNVSFTGLLKSASEKRS